jgi:hypothetical protein
MFPNQLLTKTISTMKRLFAILLMVLPMAVMAQIQFGYLSYKQVMQQMPEYAKAQQDLDLLKQKYEQEALRGEEDFQRKFVEFLQGQKDFPQTIMQKRQAELQHLMDNGVNFTAGLPVVRTSPDHGTAYDLAGQNMASENSFRQALYMAIDVYKNRQNK